MATLFQDQPGEWLLTAPFIPESVPVPSWLVEVCRASGDHDLNDLTRDLSRIYGAGRKVGYEEGKEALRNDLKSLLGLDHV